MARTRTSRRRSPTQMMNAMRSGAPCPPCTLPEDGASAVLAEEAGDDGLYGFGIATTASARQKAMFQPEQAMLPPGRVLNAGQGRIPPVRTYGTPTRGPVPISPVQTTQQVSPVPRPVAPPPQAAAPYRRPPVFPDQRQMPQAGPMRPIPGSDRTGVPGGTLQTGHRPGPAVAPRTAPAVSRMDVNALHKFLSEHRNRLGTTHAGAMREMDTVADQMESTRGMDVNTARAAKAKRRLAAARAAALDARQARMEMAQHLLDEAKATRDARQRENLRRAALRVMYAPISFKNGTCAVGCPPKEAQYQGFGDFGLPGGAYVGTEMVPQTSGPASFRDNLTPALRTAMAQPEMDTQEFPVMPDAPVDVRLHVPQAVVDARFIVPDFRPGLRMGVNGPALPTMMPITVPQMKAPPSPIPVPAASRSVTMPAVAPAAGVRPVRPGLVSRDAPVVATRSRGRRPQPPDTGWLGEDLVVADIAGLYEEVTLAAEADSEIGPEDFDFGATMRTSQGRKRAKAKRARKHPFKLMFRAHNHKTRRKLGIGLLALALGVPIEAAVIGRIRKKMADRHADDEAKLAVAAKRKVTAQAKAKAQATRLAELQAVKAASC